MIRKCYKVTQEDKCPSCKSIGCLSAEGQEDCGMPKRTEAKSVAWYAINGDTRGLVVKVEISTGWSYWLTNYIRGTTKDFYGAVDSLGGKVLAKSTLASLRADNCMLYKYSST